MLRHWSRWLIAGVMASLIPVCGLASALSIKPNAPNTYTVVKGDTLWDISALYLDSPWLWPRLWKMNDTIANPHLIYPGDRLTLTWQEGEPTLSVKPLVKLSPTIHRQDKTAAPTLKPQQIIPYLEYDLLLDKDTILQSSRVLANNDGKQLIDAEELVFISGDHSDEVWAIYRFMAEFEYENRTVLAVRKIAHAQLVSQQDQLSTLKVTNQRQEILVNDIALPEPEALSHSYRTRFLPSQGQHSMVKLLGSIEGTHYVGKDQVVVLSRGLNDGIEQGNVFELFKPSQVDKQPSVPDKRIGRLMVIRPYLHFSVAIITESSEAVGIETVLRPPEVR